MSETLSSGGLSADRFQFTPGLMDALPKGTIGKIRIFGELPANFSLQDALGNFDLDLDEIRKSAQIDISVPPPGIKITVRVIHGGTTYKQDFHIGKGVILISDMTVQEVNSVIHSH